MVKQQRWQNVAFTSPWKMLILFIKKKDANILSQQFLGGRSLKFILAFKLCHYYLVRKKKITVSQLPRAVLGFSITSVEIF